MTTLFSCFVTGTGTDIGKTLISCAILHTLSKHGVRASGMKPVASGVKNINGTKKNEDTHALMAYDTAAIPQELVTPYLFQEPIAPHIAAKQEGILPDASHIMDCYRKIAQRTNAIVVEGVGGFRVPLTENYDTADMAAQFDLPIVLVVGVRLGCINHALLTAEAIAARGLSLAGWVANKVEPNMRYQDENIAALKVRLAAPLLGVVPHLAHATAVTAAQHLDFSCLPAWPGK